MMKGIKYILILFLLLQLSCVDDQSKYGNVSIDDITIEGIDKFREVEIGTNLKIQPTVTTKFGEKSQLSYIWYKYGKDQLIADTLSYEKNLDVPIGDVIPGIITNLVYKVTDVQTGVFAVNKSTFTTVGKYSSGTLMLYSVDGKKDLAMLKTDGTTLYENVYSLANDGMMLGENSRRIILTNSYSLNPTGHKSVIVTCDDETGGVYLDPVIFTKKNTIREKFTLGNELEGAIVVTGYTANSEGDFLIANGKVYNRVNSDGSKVDWNNPELLFMSEPADYSAASATGYTIDLTFYDNRHNRFMVNKKSTGYFSFIMGTDYDLSAFNPSDMGEGVELVIMGCQNAWRVDYSWALMKDTKKDQYLLIKCKTGFNSSWKTIFIAESKKVLNPDSYPYLYGASNFVAGSSFLFDSASPWDNYVLGVPNMFFYLKDNKVYAFNVETSSEGILINGDTENYTITGLSCTGMGDPYSDDAYTQITLAIKDRSLASKQGGIAVYRLNDLGGVSAKKMYAKTGFCDEVLYTVEKQN